MNQGDSMGISVFNLCFSVDRMKWNEIDKELPKAVQTGRFLQFSKMSSVCGQEYVITACRLQSTMRDLESCINRKQLIEPVGFFKLHVDKVNQFTVQLSICFLRV